MAALQPPIIVLRQSDDAVSAFLSKAEALGHLSGGLGDEHGLGENAAGADFFDARGRRLTPVLDSHGQLEDLAVESEDSHADHVRDRVRHRSVHARETLDRDRPNFEDRSPLTLADEDIEFEVFAWRLASVLRPEKTAWNDPKTDSRGWWHNTFSH